MPSMNLHRTYELKLFCSGKSAVGREVYGELTVSGFATAQTANAIGKKFAGVLKEHWGLEDVDMAVKADRTYLIEESDNGRDV